MKEETLEEAAYRLSAEKFEPKQEIVINEKCSKCGSSQYQIGKPFCTDEFCNTDIGKASEDYWLKQPYNEDAFVEGAKWQAERMYSEEDMKNCFHAGEMHCATEGKVYERSANFEVWFEQFKNK